MYEVLFPGNRRTISRNNSESLLSRDFMYARILLGVVQTYFKTTSVLRNYRGICRHGKHNNNIRFFCHLYIYQIINCNRIFIFLLCLFIFVHNVNLPRAVTPETSTFLYTATFASLLKPSYFAIRYLTRVTRILLFYPQLLFLHFFVYTSIHSIKLLPEYTNSLPYAVT